MREYPSAAQQLRLEMDRRGYTLEQLSRETTISVNVLRPILTGHSRRLSTRTVCALAEVFGYGMAEFIDILAQE